MRSPTTGRAGATTPTSPRGLRAAAATAPAPTERPRMPSGTRRGRAREPRTSAALQGKNASTTEGSATPCDRGRRRRRLRDGASGSRRCGTFRAGHSPPQTTERVDPLRRNDPAQHRRVVIRMPRVSVSARKVCKRLQDQGARPGQTPASPSGSDRSPRRRNSSFAADRSTRARQSRSARSETARRDFRPCRCRRDRPTRAPRPAGARGRRPTSPGGDGRARPGRGRPHRRRGAAPRGPPGSVPGFAARPR